MSALLPRRLGAGLRRHPGYRRMFAADALTLGLFLPLRFWCDMRVLRWARRGWSKKPID